MGRKSSIDPETGARLLDAYQRLGSKSAAAREIGVSEDAATRFFAQTPKAAAPSVATQQQIVERAHASLFDSRAVIEDSYRRIITLADQLAQGITLINGEYQTLVSPAVSVAAIKEIREHVKTAIELGKLMIDIEEVRAWQHTVIEAIGDADEPTRQRIIAKLRERRALGLAAR